jgi:hypothetical protein
MDTYQILWDAAIYLSLAALVLFIFVFLTGLRVIKPKAKWHLHKKLAIWAGSLVGSHAIIMLYFYFFT